ncbi:hypothetical protein [Kushneria indalinina]|uniref:Uncharacterized protein n=1 Tax=Kushneria indalinina DSM 14324 TaxID=1122140 RepID=A0A3D9DXS1_9GAMM|nr:hypothetical protein [Kushneria indalinina]REC95563.1 hypothetical protein C8D72_0216 [Kushneria indalinina DSM 14324]
MKDKVVLNWWPIYLEPILDSDEKICVGVCYESPLEGFFYKKTLKKSLSDAFFKERKSAVSNLAEYACEYAIDLLRKQNKIEGLEVAPGIYLGRKRLAEGYELHEIHTRVLRKVSFFSYLDFYQKQAVSSEAQKGFADFVQDHLLKRNSNLAAFFNRQLRVSGAVRTFDFADKAGRLATNFYVFQRNSRIYKAEVSCLELSMVKSSYKKVSLVAMVDPDYNSKAKRLRSYKEVEGVAEHLNVFFRVVESPEEAANYLQENAA